MVKERNYGLRISRSYNDLGLDLLPLYQLCQRVIIFEHQKDDKVERTHIHGLLMGCSRSDDTIRNTFLKKYYHEKDGKKVYDYELIQKWKDKVTNTIKPVDMNYITYMGKGHLEPLYQKGIPKDESSEYVRMWKDFPTHSGVITPKQGTLDKIVITKEVEEQRRKVKYDMVQDIAQKWKEDGYEDLEEHAIRVLRHNRQCIGFHKVIEFCDAAEMYGSTSSFVDKVRRHREKRSNY
jgi:hypothetical protein